MCCCSVLGSWFSCSMKQYDRPPLIHLCTFSLFYSHTLTHGCSWRKSCFIYEMYSSKSSKSHRVLRRVRACTHTHPQTHTVFGLWSLFFVALSHTIICTLAAGHLFTLSAVLALQTYTVVWAWPWSSPVGFGELLPDSCWMCCFRFFFYLFIFLCGSSSVKGWYHLHVREAEMPSGHTKSLWWHSSES